MDLFMDMTTVRGVTGSGYDDIESDGHLVELFSTWTYILHANECQHVQTLGSTCTIFFYSSCFFFKPHRFKNSQFSHAPANRIQHCKDFSFLTPRDEQVFTSFWPVSSCFWTLFCQELLNSVPPPWARADSAVRLLARLIPFLPPPELPAPLSAPLKIQHSNRHRPNGTVWMVSGPEYRWPTSLSHILSLTVDMGERGLPEKN